MKKIKNKKIVYFIRSINMVHNNILNVILIKRYFGIYVNFSQLTYWFHYFNFISVHVMDIVNEHNHVYNTLLKCY